MRRHESGKNAAFEWEGLELVRRGWLRLESLRSRFETQTGSWTERDRGDLVAIAESLTELQLKVDSWPRSDARRCASREIQKVVRVSEELLSRPNFVDALNQRIRRDLDIDDPAFAEIPWEAVLKESYAKPADLLVDVERNSGSWKSLPWGIRVLVKLRLRDPSLNDWWFRKPK